MPQGHRKTPFSGKQKKAQLAAKRQTKNFKTTNVLKKRTSSRSEGSEDETLLGQLDRIQKINVQSKKDSREKSNRYALQFHQETEKEMRAMKEDAHRKIVPLPESALEVQDDFFTGYNFPIRPTWAYSTSKQELDRVENEYFNEYILFKVPKTNLNVFELNLETWRQLWRVLEISDIILMIVDIRYPSLMFPPSLFEYITQKVDKSMILVLNKIDLAPAHLVLAWKKYFEEKYPQLHIVMFTAYPKYNLRGSVNINNATSLQIRRRRGKPKMAAEGAFQVMKACMQIVNGQIDLTDWEQKIRSEMNSTDETSDDIGSDGSGSGATGPEFEKYHDENFEFDFEERTKYSNGILTVGCVGFPNVGKSSLLNALIGRKVVSVSRTPGHTKHFQTIFLTNNVRLCDCPGLVFPSSTPRPVQVLLGSYPIAQLRAPYASIKYLAERCDIPHILNIKQVDGDEDWSPVEICESWALKRGFLTAKAGRPDSYRAANHILRMALQGQISLCLRPPTFSEDKDKWLTHPDLEEILTIQAIGKSSGKDEDIDDAIISDSDESEHDDEEDSDDDTLILTKNTFAGLEI